MAVRKAAQEPAAEAAVTEEVKAVEETKTAEIKAAVEAVVYIGPTIKGIVRSNTVFNKGLPEKVQALIKEKPIANELLVPVGSLAEKKKELFRKNSQLAVFFDALK